GPMLEEAAKRKMLADVLLPQEEQRPPMDLKDKGAQENLKEKRAQKKLIDLDTIKLDDLRALAEGRVEEVTGLQDRVEKRQAIAYLLFTAAMVKKPDGQPLDAQAMDRTAAVLGLDSFTHAVATQTNALRALQERVTIALDEDRYRFATQYTDKLKQIQ